MVIPLWRHQMEMFSALLVLCEGNPWAPVDCTHKGHDRGVWCFLSPEHMVDQTVEMSVIWDIHCAHCDVAVMVAAHRNLSTNVRVWFIVVRGVNARCVSYLLQLVRQCVDIHWLHRNLLRTEPPKENNMSLHVINRTALPKVSIVAVTS